jgi:hypothetical protein
MAKKHYEMRARGDVYVITPSGYIKRTDMPFKASHNWRVYGVSTHHWQNSPKLKWPEIRNMLDKGKTVEGYFWDVDHGTIRTWGGSYAGKLPRAKLKKVM